PPAFNDGIQRITGLMSDTDYVFSFEDQTSGKTAKRLTIRTDRNGQWPCRTHFWKLVPVWQDWVIILRKK
ncbi:MAG: hypothetical protein NC907_00430, partial [Candidatus Omnitrophica bacterium]|nr:hypothetical protein [Candidatus Omnitrophota bacterium]